MPPRGRGLHFSRCARGAPAAEPRDGSDREPCGRGAHLEDARVAQHAVPGHPQPLVLAARCHLRQAQGVPRGPRHAETAVAGATGERKGQKKSRKGRVTAPLRCGTSGRAGTEGVWGCGGRTASPRLLATATPWVRRCDGSGSEHFRLAGRNGKSERNGKSGAAALCGGTKGERVSGGAVRCGAVLRRAAWCGAALC